jgi:hypothetical protein
MTLMISSAVGVVLRWLHVDLQWSLSVTSSMLTDGCFIEVEDAI